MRSTNWVIAILLLTAGPSQAGIGITVKGGSLGVGAEGTLGLVPMVNLRGGLNILNVSRSLSAGDIDYDGDLELKSAHVLADLHPIPFRGFRVSGGLIYNANGLTLTSKEISTSIEVGGETYPVSDVGTLVSQVDFNTTAPYFGIGWGNAAASRFVFALDVGVMFQGAPQVTSRATGSIASDPTFQQELRQETQQQEDDIACQVLPGSFDWVRFQDYTVAGSPPCCPTAEGKGAESRGDQQAKRAVGIFAIGGIALGQNEGRVPTSWTRPRQMASSPTMV